MTGTITLAAADLLEPGGFGDGAILDGILAGAGFAPSALSGAPGERVRFSRAVLVACLARHLAPRLGGVEICYDLRPSRNPAGLRDRQRLDPVVRAALDGVEATLSPAQVLAVAEGLAPGFPGARAEAPARPEPEARDVR